MNLTRTDKIICVDPGAFSSGVVIFDGLEVFEKWADFDNNSLCLFLTAVNRDDISELVIEGISSFGMAVGKTTFETVEWIGRFRQAFGFDNSHKILRRDVKLFLCNSARAKDKNIRQAILDIFPATGGGKTAQIGTKRKPGPLYGVKSHCFSALAVGLTYKYGL